MGSLHYCHSINTSCETSWDFHTIFSFFTKQLQSSVDSVQASVSWKWRFEFEAVSLALQEESKCLRHFSRLFFDDHGAVLDLDPVGVWGVETAVQGHGFLHERVKRADNIENRNLKWMSIKLKFIFWDSLQIRPECRNFQNGGQSISQKCLLTSTCR